MTGRVKNCASLMSFTLKINHAPSLVRTEKIPLANFRAWRSWRTWREDIRCGNCFPQCLAQSSQRALAREDVISNETDPQLSNFDATLDLGFDTAIYSADADPVYTPKEVYARPDRVAHGRTGAKVSEHEGQKVNCADCSAEPRARQNGCPGFFQTQKPPIVQSSLIYYPMFGSSN